jgi:prepilin-type N-terminal cleavage/methylation domain-containing protein
MSASLFNRSRAAAFTLVETLIAIVILGILVGALAPVVSRQVSHSRVNNAAHLLVADLESALSLAGRQRSPVRLTVDAAQRTVFITDRATGNVITRRSYGPDSEFKVDALTAAPASTDLLPQGMATSATTVTVAIGSYSRRVSLTRAGLVRLQP